MRRRTLFRQVGLTLVEVLVAMALLGIVSVMAYRGLDSMSTSSRHALTAAEHWRNVGMLFERLSSDAWRAARRPVREGGSGAFLPPWWGRRDGASDQLEFTRRSSPGRDEVRLAYRLREGRIELVIWPVLDRAPQSAPDVHVLLEGVSSLAFRHLDHGGAWQDVWPPPTGRREELPRAVQVEIVLNTGVSLRRVFALPT